MRTYLWDTTLAKLIWPHPLVPVYPRWQVAPSPPFAWLSLLAFIPVLALLWAKRHTWGRPAFVALAYFGGLLFTVLGFFNVDFFRFSFVSDHFVYLASMGPFALVAAGITLAFRSSLSQDNESRPYSKLKTQKSKLEYSSPLYFVLCAYLLAILATLTWCQCHIYSDNQTFWRATLAHNPNAFSFTSTNFGH